MAQAARTHECPKLEENNRDDHITKKGLDPVLHNVFVILMPVLVVFALKLRLWLLWQRGRP